MREDAKVKKQITVNPENDGDRLDIFLTKYYKTVSRTNMQRHIGNGYVQVNGTLVKSSYLLSEGDVIDLVEFREEEVRLEPEPVQFDVLYCDDQIIVLDKPSGIVVHPGSRNVKGTLVNGLLYRFRDLPTVPDPMRPGIVHRLDKDTSGVMVAARTVHAYEDLKNQFKTRTTRKKYLTIVHGVPRFTSNIIDSPIGTAITRANSMKMEISPEGKEAVTRYDVVEELDRFSLVEVSPKTGRTHQIRLHMASIGHPVLCDPKYGREAVIRRNDISGSSDHTETVLSRMALHAFSLTFVHPGTGISMTFTSKIPSELIDFIKVVKYYEPA